MINTIVQERPANRIWISRDWSRYTCKRFENGTLTAVEVITESRAKEIIGENPDGYTVGHEPVCFEGFGGQFAFEIPMEVIE